jgi:hypothetical protein
LLFLFLSGCSPHVPKEPGPLAYYPTVTERQSLVNYPEAEAPINNSSVWGKEILLGREFAKEGDWYRALTSFRKARFLLQLDNALTPERDARLAWSESLIYGFAGKWQDVITTWEKYRSHFTITNETLKEQWLILLYAAYLHESREEEAEDLCALLPKKIPAVQKLHEWKTLSYIQSETPLPKQPTPMEKIVFSQLKSPTKARVMNALLPGLGYLYVDQKKTALTSLLLNTCFIGAGIQLLNAHQPFLAIITLSFEAGWYFGGVTGAGIAAEQYNEAMKTKVIQPYLREQKAFPLLQIEVGW